MSARQLVLLTRRQGAGCADAPLPCRRGQRTWDFLVPCSIISSLICCTASSTAPEAASSAVKPVGMIVAFCVHGAGNAELFDEVREEHAARTTADRARGLEIIEGAAREERDIRRLACSDPGEQIRWSARTRTPRGC